MPFAPPSDVFRRVICDVRRVPDPAPPRGKAVDASRRFAFSPIDTLIDLEVWRGFAQ